MADHDKLIEDSTAAKNTVEAITSGPGIAPVHSMTPRAAPSQPLQAAPAQPLQAAPAQPLQAAPSQPLQAALADNQAMTADEFLAREIMLAELPPDREFLPERTDMRTVIAELTALKSEIRAVTRANRDLRDALAEALPAMRSELNQLIGRQSAADALPWARALTDMADRLDATMQSAAALRPRRGWLFGARRALHAFVDGLRLTRERLAEHLAELGVTRIPTLGQDFDPETMEVMDIEPRDDVAEGVVVAEITAGYRHHGQVLRNARVIVARESR